MPSFLSFLMGEAEGQSSDPAVAAAPSEEEHPLPKSLDEDGEADAVTKAIGTLLRWPTARTVPIIFGLSYWPLLSSRLLIFLSLQIHRHLLLLIYS